jgi:hypothetical protein
MRDRRILLTALCGLLVTMIGCQVQQPVAPVTPVQPTAPRGTVRVQVDPTAGAFNYAHPGETLEFSKLFPSSSDFYVIFVGISPCEDKTKMYLELKGDAPASCTVGAASTYQFYISATLPSQLKGTPAVQPRVCPACQLIVAPQPGSGKTPPPAGGTPPPVSPKAAKVVGKAAAPPNYAPVSVSCDSGTVTVAPVEQSPTNGIFWMDSSGGGLNVTVPDGTCSEGTSIPAGLPGCILLNTARSTSYSVKVQDSSCSTPGTGQLTVTSESKK